jgi:Fe-Mn family superoxide dismutase
MAFELPALPWAKDALAPHVSADTIGFHHGKHHAAYISKLNAAVEGTPMAEMSLEQIMLQTAGDAAKAGIFNNAAQTWNHTFFWNSMSPDGGGEPTGRLKEMIDESFGSFDAFKEEFSNKAVTLFGSGWTWLVVANGKLEIVQTVNAGNPMTDGKTPLITLDVWEHAYYLDFQNRRPDFIQAFLAHLVNWKFATENLAKS